MVSYSITFARTARKELEGLEAAVAARIFRAIELLAENPRPHGCQKLRGPADLWRIRVGEYRVVYTIDDSDGIVDIVIIRHRRDVYR